MLRVFFFLLPLLFVVVAGPLWLASKRRGASTWFPAQIITLFTMLITLGGLHKGWFGDPAGPLYMLVVTLGAAMGVLISWVILPRAD